MLDKWTSGLALTAMTIVTFFHSSLALSQEGFGELYPLDSSDAVESEEPYEFFQLSKMFADWKSSFELGLNGSEGNSQNFNLSAGFDFARKTDSDDTKVTFRYANASNDGVETRNFALLKGRREFLFEDSPWSLFTEGLLEFDEFQAFDYRLTAATGFSYRFIDDGTTLFKTRTGLGVSREFGGPNDDWKPEATFGFDFKRKINDNQSFYCTADYYPNFEDFSDFRLITDLGWEITLDKEYHTSLKLGVIDRYDSTPEGREANDFTYSVLLLWKTK